MTGEIPTHLEGLASQGRQAHDTPVNIQTRSPQMAITAKMAMKPDSAVVTLLEVWLF